MNLKRGLSRLGIVVALFWISFWSGYAWWGYRQTQLALENLRSLSPNEGLCFSDAACFRLQAHWMGVMDMGNDALNASAVFGVGIPVVLLILFPFAWFVYRGFRPKVNAAAMTTAGQGA